MSFVDTLKREKLEIVFLIERLDENGEVGKGEMFTACAFSEQEVGGSVKPGSRILRGQGRGFFMRPGSRILRHPTDERPILWGFLEFADVRGTGLLRPRIMRLLARCGRRRASRSPLAQLG